MLVVVDKSQQHHAANDHQQACKKHEMLLRVHLKHVWHQELKFANRSRRSHFVVEIIHFRNFQN